MISQMSSEVALLLEHPWAAWTFDGAGHREVHLIDARQMGLPPAFSEVKPLAASTLRRKLPFKWVQHDERCSWVTCRQIFEVLFHPLLRLQHRSDGVDVHGHYSDGYLASVQTRIANYAARVMRPVRDATRFKRPARYAARAVCDPRGMRPALYATRVVCDPPNMRPARLATRAT